MTRYWTNFSLNKFFPEALRPTLGLGYYTGQNSSFNIKDNETNSYRPTLLDDADKKAEVWKRLRKAIWWSHKPGTRFGSSPTIRFQLLFSYFISTCLNTICVLRMNRVETIENSVLSQIKPQAPLLVVPFRQFL